MNWYKESFSKDYLLIYPHRNSDEAIEQINFLLNTIPLTKNAKILDLCCGAGRHSIELIKRGYDVVSADLSADLLDVAKSESIPMKLVRCDMRHIPFVNQFDLIIQFFTSFGYFQTDDQNQKVLDSIALALKSEGYFLIDYMNVEYVINNLVDRDEKDISDIHIIQERWIADNRINKKITIIRNGSEKYYTESVRLYSHKEMQCMIENAGLILIDTYGDFYGNKFNSNSPRMILIGKHK